MDIHRVKIDLCAAAVRDILKMHLLIFQRVWRWAKGELQYASRYDDDGGWGVRPWEKRLPDSFPPVHWDTTTMWSVYILTLWINFEF